MAIQDHLPSVTLDFFGNRIFTTLSLLNLAFTRFIMRFIHQSKDGRWRSRSRDWELRHQGGRAIMKRTRTIMYAAAGIALAVAFWFIMEPQHRLANEPLHSAVEAVEALSVLLMAFLLLSRKEEGDALVLPALGFLGMSILD